MGLNKQRYVQKLEKAIEAAYGTRSVEPALNIASEAIDLGQVHKGLSATMLVQMVAAHMALCDGYDLVTELGPYQIIRDELIRLGMCSVDDVRRREEGVLLAFGRQYGFLDKRQWERLRDAIVRDDIGDAEALLRGIVPVDLPRTSDTTRRLSTVFMRSIASDWRR
ncbi:hypothetical protein [Actinokineospora sp. NPDC004072]